MQAAALIRAAPVLVRRAGETQGALLALVKALRTSMPSLWRASIHQLMAGKDQLEIVAVWSAGETHLKTGVRMSVMATSFPEVVRREAPIVERPDPSKPQPLPELLAAEGAQAWITVPLRRKGGVIGLLTFSVSDEEAFDGSDATFFAQLGETIEEDLVALMR
jgi:transcriptional regulator with GAF, ATPase, and Fis domain